MKRASTMTPVSVICVFLAVYGTAVARQSPQDEASKPTAAVQTQIDEAIKLPVNDDQVRALEKVLAAARTSVDKAGEAKVLFQIGRVYENMGRPEKALGYFSKALPIERQVKDKIGEARALHEMGTVYQGLEQFGKALSCYEDALHACRASKDPVGEAIQLEEIGNLYIRIRQPDSSLSDLDQALTLRRVLKDSRGEAQDLQNLGVAHEQMGQPNQAISFFEASLRIWREANDRQFEAEAIQSLAMAYRDMGQSGKALEYFNESLSLRRELKDKGGEAAELNQLSSLYLRISQSDKALSCLDRSLEIRREMKDRLGEAEQLNALSTFYSQTGQLAKLLSCLEQSLQICRTLRGRVGEARELNFIGDFYASMGQWAKALDYYKQNLKVDRELNNSYDEAVSLCNIGIAYRDSGRSLEALDYLNQGLKLVREVKYKLMEGEILSAIGFTNLKMGHWNKALDDCTQAVTISREVRSRRFEAQALMYIGIVHIKTGQPKKALTYSNMALAIAREIKEKSVEAAALDSIGEALKGLKLNNVAIAELKLSVNVYQSLRASTKGLAKELQQSYTQQHAGTYRALADLLIDQGRLSEAQEVLNLLKDEEYFRFLRSAPTNQVDLTPREAKWKLKYEALGGDLASADAEFDALENLSATQPLTKAQAARMAELDQKLQNGRRVFEEFLMSAEAAFAKADARMDRIEGLKTYGQLAEIIRDLPGRTAAIYTFATNDGVRTILTLPNVTQLKAGAPQRIAFADLSRKIQLLKTELTDPQLDPKPLARELYDILIRPLSSDLKKAKVKNLLFSLDGPLRYIPLAALYDRLTGQWLCQQYALSLFTPANLLKMTGEPAGKITAEGFGVSRTHVINGIKFPGLSGVSAELGSFARIWNGSVFEDSKFTSSTFKAELFKHPSLVHLATHFELKPGDSANSFLVMGDGSSLSVRDFAGWRQNVLRGVDLFVISACDTATPSGDGDEFESFARAAQDNGAAAVLATLWPVNDKSTGLFMAHFYALRKNHPEVTKAQALSQTQDWLRKTLTGRVGRPSQSKAGVDQRYPTALPVYKYDPTHPYSHPFYWAPFVLIGNVR